MASQSLHLSKCHIVGNLMSRLINNIDFLSLSIVFALGNSADPDKMSHMYPFIGIRDTRG